MYSSHLWRQRTAERLDEGEQAPGVPLQGISHAEPEMGPELVKLPPVPIAKAPLEKDHD